MRDMPGTVRVQASVLAKAGTEGAAQRLVDSARGHVERLQRAQTHKQTFANRAQERRAAKLVHRAEQNARRTGLESKPRRA